MSGGRQQNWPRNAETLAARFASSVLHPSVLRWLRETPFSGRAGIACSGGADSLCLLLLLWAHFPERRQRWVVLHFDHRLRGEASRADAAFVTGVARELGLEVRQAAWERAEGARAGEEAARAARFAFFEEAIGKAGALFLGHNRDDIVETHLMRLSRGSGTAGLAAPRPVQAFGSGRVHLRPLLALGGDEIRGALAELGIPFCRDATNEGLAHYRNRIRLEVVPLWQKHSPFDVAAGAAAARGLLEEDDEALEAWLRELLPSAEPGDALDLSLLRGKPRALWRRALRRWLAPSGAADTLSRNAFDALLEAAEAGEALRASAGKDAFIELSAARVVRLTRGPRLPSPLFERPWPLPLNGRILLPGGRSLCARAFSLDSAARTRILSGRVEAAKEAFLESNGGRLSVRHWQPGDRHRGLGAPGSRKLQDCFVDLKIPEAERYRLPVVLLGDEIAWAPGLPPSEAFKINHLTKTVVQLTYDCGKAV